MRRGHPGIGGWRNENPRHFRPRTGVAPRFRPPRLFSLLDGPRLPPPGPRLTRGKHPYNTHSVHSDEHGLPDHNDRPNYRNPGHPHNLRLQGHQPRPRNVYSYTNPNLTQENNIQISPYKHSSKFFNEGQGDMFHVNSLGDIDQRQLSNVPHTPEEYNPHRINPWTQPDQRNFYGDRNPQLYYRQHDSDRQHTEGSKIPSLDYTGHRPPSSDYYGSTSSTTVNNNNTSFSRSVDDTVDIVRKRLMNRNEPQPITQDASVTQNSSEQEISENANQHQQQELPTKKRIQRQRQNVKSNCDKMKSNIVHQLFKMDKDKMHKLMDDPGSSSKFEYAISSLITESQNSLNRHMRSVAEKSLVSTSSDFIHNDNNTIYEDTFMKQMQCLLDPQDTVLLEDIKPLVMAELSKVLQLDDFESRYDAEDQNLLIREDHQNYVYQHTDQHYDNYNYDEYPQEAFYDIDQRTSTYSDSGRVDVTDSTAQNFNYDIQRTNNEGDYQNHGSLFERRNSKKSDVDQDDRRHSIDSQRRRKSVDKPSEPIARFSPVQEHLPLFDTNAEQLSEDEDTFAELDRQYHVAVDHNFLDDVSARTTPNYTQQLDINPVSIKREIDCQLQSFAQSPPKISSSGNNDVDERKFNAIPNIKEEVFQSPDFPKENSTPVNFDNNSSRIEHVNKKPEHAARYKDTATEREMEKSKSSSVSKTSASNSRKRSVDQRPSHRKEKRKKSESSSSEAGKTSSHRHNTVISKDGHSKSTEKCQDTHKPYYSIFTSKDESKKDLSREHSRNDNGEKGYSDKYVKRKESRKSKDHHGSRKRSSSSSSQTILSPKDSCNNSVTPTKGDPKTKLKTIDMFVEQTKKVSVHQAHRNTAPNPVTTPKAEEKPKQVTTPPCKVVSTKHASTQVIRRVITKETQTFETKNVSSRFCQTERTKLVSKGSQTSSIDDTHSGSNKKKIKSSDAFERMKEIDLEIQDLLQEKFQLYNNLESKNAGPHAEQSYLSMTVLNVANIGDQDEKATTDEPETNVDKTKADDENVNSDSNMNADDIADDFTSIPVEELEQIALESVGEVNFSQNKTDKKSARRKALQQERRNSESPKSTSSRRSAKKTKTPNISLIEQIITDDRPLEDIIPLDDLEATSSKHKKRPHRSKPKKKSLKRSKSVKSMDISSYNLKECSVILNRIDISKYIKQQSEECEEVPVEIDHFDILEPFKGCTLQFKESPERQKSSEPREIVEESVVNDLQFDMLDVSEDIVIGESCEIKDKDLNEHTMTISEDLILDNSQSSADDAVQADSGQTESECKMYDYSTDEELRRDSLTVTGNVDSVLAIECIESDFIAACLDGNVYHFSGDGQLLNTMRGSNLAVTCLTIVKEKYGTTVYTGSLDSRIRYYDLDTGLEKGPECNVLSPIQTMDRAWDTVFVGTRTGFVLQFECKNNMLIPVSTVKFSEQAILALRAMKEGPRKVLLVASRSENVTIKDAQTGLLLRTLAGPMMTVYTLLFEDGKVYCGTSSHQIHVFDYASGTHTGCHEGGKGAVCLRATGGLLFAGCYDGCIYVYREGETRPLAQLRGPSLMLLSLAVVGSKIIAGYKDRSLYIWKIPLSVLQEMIL